MANRSAASTVDESRKVRWSVPAADVSVIDWLDAQHNVGNSLRTLIRESIERDGVVDVYFKPVTQQPRRGRPPGRAADQDQAQEESTEQRNTVLYDEAGEPDEQGKSAQVSEDREPAPAPASVRATARRRPAAGTTASVQQPRRVRPAAANSVVPVSGMASVTPTKVESVIDDGVADEAAEAPTQVASAQPTQQPSINEMFASTRR